MRIHLDINGPVSVTGYPATPATPAMIVIEYADDQLYICGSAFDLRDLVENIDRACDEADEY